VLVLLLYISKPLCKLPAYKHHKLSGARHQTPLALLLLLHLLARALLLHCCSAAPHRMIWVMLTLSQGCGSCSCSRCEK
jgi:hypothetical protein